MDLITYALAKKKIDEVVESGAKYIELTQEEYDLLPTEEKLDPTKLYFVPSPSNS